MAEELLEETISAADFRAAFIDWLGDDAAELPRHKTIRGDLDLGGLTVDRMVTLRGRVFDGNLDLYDTQFSRSVSMSGCEINGILNLSDSVIEGSLDLSAASIGRRDDFSDEAVEAVRQWLGTVPHSPAVAGLWQQLPRTVTGLRELVFEIPPYIRKHESTLETAVLDWWSTRPDFVEQWATVTVAGWLNNLQVRGNVTFSGTTFWGQLFQNSMRAGGDLSLAGARVRGYLIAIGLDCDGALKLARSTVEGDCILENARAGGHLLLRDGRFESLLNLHSARCDARVIADNLSCHDISLESLQVGGNVSFQNAVIGGHFQAQSMRVAGRFSLDSTDAGRSGILSWANFSNAECGQGFSARGAEFGDLLTLEALHARFVDLNATPAQATRIRGWFSMADAEIAGDVRMSGTSIAGDALFSQAKCGGLYFSPAVVADGEGNWRLVIPRARSLNAIGIEVRGPTALLCLHVGAGERVRAVGRRDGLIDLRMARLGTLFTWTPHFVEEAVVAASAWGAEPSIDVHCEDLGLRATQLWMNGATTSLLDLDNALIAADPRAPASRYGGLVDLSDCRIEGDLDWNNHTGQPERVGCNRLNASTLRCDGDVNLSGVYTTVAPDEYESHPAAVNLRDASIHGQVRLHKNREERLPSFGQVRDTEAFTGHAAGHIHAPRGAPDAEARGAAPGYEPTACSSLSGPLRLDAATVGHLIVSGESFDRIEAPVPPRRRWWQEVIQAATFNLFCRPNHPDDPPAIVNLERATIRRLEIRDPLPTPVDLTRVTVERWELPSAPDPRNLSDDERVAEPYLRLLACASPFKRSNYAMIDRALRDRGENAASDMIFRAMKHELLRRERRWVRQVGGLLHAFIGFGTRWQPMLVMLTVLAAASVAIFTAAGGIEIHPDMRSALVEGGQDPGVMRWDPGQWPLSRRIGAATALTLRYHVPLISLPAFEGFRAGPGLPMTWATVMTGLHWVLLPLILTSLIPAIVRRRDEA